MNYVRFLTATERRVANLYADGAGFAEIARHLGRSPHTIRTHLKNVYRKLGVQSKIALRNVLEAEGLNAGSCIDPDQIREDLALLRAARMHIGEYGCIDRDEVYADLQYLIALHPGLASAHASLAFLTGRKAFVTHCPVEAEALLDQATQHAETALTRNAFDVDAHLALGRARVFAGDLSSGEKHIRLALDCNPDLPWAQYMLAFVLMHQGCNSEAIAVGETFWNTLSDDDVAALMALTLACAHFGQGDLRAATHWAASVLRNKRAYDQLAVTASVILAGAGEMSLVASHAQAMPGSICDMTPLQSRLHARNGVLVDVLDRHRDDLTEIFAA